MGDDELAQIRARRMAQMQQQSGAGGRGGQVWQLNENNVEQCHCIINYFFIVKLVSLIIQPNLKKYLLNF